MLTLHIRHCCVLVACCVALLPAKSPGQESLSHLLDTMFDPSRAPAHKTMGLLQRDFLDLAQGVGPRLQVAFVIDGTDSMATQLPSVRQVLQQTVEDLGRVHAGTHEYALVVYRDAQAPSGEVTLPRRRFTSDREAFAKLLEPIQPETGAPYFHELPDLGLHAAMTQLDWNAEEDVGRWIFLFADAPPYDPDFHEAETTARRRRDTDVLVSLANDKRIRINTVLCESDASEFDAYSRCLPTTRRFLNRLSTGTDGVMVDLSYQDVRQALADAAQVPRVTGTPIVPIRYQEVRAAQASSSPITLAVLPFITAGATVDDIRPQMESQLDQRGLMKLEGEEFAFASEVRFKLKQVPGLRVRSPRRVEEELGRMRMRPGALDLHLRRLADRLDVDYLLYGFHLTRGDETVVRSALYARDTGRQFRSPSTSIAQQPETEASIRLVSTAESEITKFAARTIQREEETQEASPIALARALADDASYRGVAEPISYEPAARRAFLQATVLLERALASTSAQADSMETLTRAQELIDVGLKQDESNPIGNALSASCAFNRAQILYRSQSQDAADVALAQARRALVRAHREQAKAPNRWMGVEISADYHLLGNAPDYARAVELYASLVDPEADIPDYLRLRGHWMLAGIYAGDWGVPAGLTDPERARQHVLEILAKWPNSSQARLYKKQLRWNEETGSSVAFLPRSHAWVAQR